MLLGYNKQEGKYGCLSMDLWVREGLNSGCYLEFWDSDSEAWVPAVLKMSRDYLWYLEAEDDHSVVLFLEGLKVRLPDYTSSSCSYVE